MSKFQSQIDGAESKQGLLDLTGSAITADEMKEIMSAVEKNASIKYLKFLRCEINAEGAAALGEGLGKNNNILQLNIESNPIGEDGAVALAAGFKANTSLTRLNIVKVGMGAKTADVLDALEGKDKLVKIDISANDIGANAGEVIAKYLKGSPKLQEFEYIRAPLGDAGVTAIAQALPAGIQKLVLRDNQIGTSGATALAEGLKNKASLLQFELSESQAGAGGITAITGALSGAANLDLVKVNDNGFGDDGAKAVAELVGKCSKLRSLNIAKNGIGASGAGAVAGAITESKSIQEVNNEGNDTSKDDDIKKAVARNKTESSQGEQDNNQKYTLEEVLELKDDTIDMNKREEYLTPDEFKKYFNMTLEEFRELPGAEQQQQKKTLKLA